MTESDCIFCKIVSGQIPAQKLYDDGDASGGVIAFLDIGPVARGHLLVVPKVHALTLDKLPIDAAAAVGQALVKISAALVKVTGMPAWNVLQNNGKLAGQLVPHVHFHVVPRYDKQSGFTYDWPSAPLKPADADELTAKITEALRG